MDGTVGGSHHCLLETVKYLNREKYNPSVLFFQENALVPDFRKICDVYIIVQNKGLVIENDFPLLHTISRGNKYLGKAILYCQKMVNFFGYYVPNLVAIRKFVKNHEIDLVHANNFPDLTDWLIVSKLLKIKIVSHLRFPWSPNHARKMLIGYYDRVISISNYVTDQLKVKGIPCDNVVTIHDGIDIKSIPLTDNIPKDVLLQYDLPEGVFIIGVIGNIRRWKGQHVAIESLKYIVDKYSNIRCIFIGEISNSEYDAEYYDYLKELVVKYNLTKNVIFTGYRKDVFNILSKLDILVHTSILPEPFGRVVLEGMIFKKPVIATNHGGPKESIVDGISGFLVEPESPELLAEKILFLMENKDIARKVGENALKRVEETFSIEGNVQKIEEIYSSCFEP